MCCNNGWGGNNCLWIILILILIYRGTYKMRCG